MKSKNIISIILTGIMVGSLVSCNQHNVISSSNSVNTISSLEKSETSSSETSSIISSKTESSSIYQDSSSNNSDVSIRIASTVNTVSVGYSITIRVLVSGTNNREVTWSSSDTSVATIDSNGKVTGIKAGITRVTVTLVEDPNVKTFIDIAVIDAETPTSIEIDGESVREGWVGESTQLEVTINPKKADLNLLYTSSNSEVANVNEAGLVSFLKTGNVIITVRSAVNEDVYDTVTFNVKKGTFIANKNGYSANMDYTHQADEENPYIETNYELIEGDNKHAFAMFNIKSKKYYAEATISMTNSKMLEWGRFGIGSASDDIDYAARAFYFCPYVSGNKVTVMMDIPNTWGAITAQSQIFNVNGINNMDHTNIKMGILRDGNEYYYLINDQLYWYEINDKFDGVDTHPTIIVKDATVQISNWSYTVNEDEITTKKLLNTMSTRFFDAGTIDSNVNYVSDNEFKFEHTNNDVNSHFQNYCVKPIGDKALVSGDFELEFDLENVQSQGPLASNDRNTRIGVALRHVGVENPFKSDAFTMTDVANEAPIFDYRPFEWTGSDHTFWQYQDTDFRKTADGDEVEGHYKVVRKINSVINTLELYYEGEKVLEVTNTYIGDYHIMFGANICTGTIKNPTWRNI